MTDGVKHDNGKPPARFFYYSGFGILVDSRNDSHEVSFERNFSENFEKLIQELGKKNNDNWCLAYSEHLERILYEELERTESIPRSEAVLNVSKVSELGATKYGIFNYQKGMKWSRLVDACGRHFIQYVSGEKKDKESGLNHLYHALANIYMLAYYVNRSIGENDLIEGEEENE